MNINIGRDRWVKFTRDTQGEWRGTGYGFRFRITRIREPDSPPWLCRVWVNPRQGPVLASCRFHRMKTAAQEGARLADIAQAKHAVEATVE